MGQSALFSWDLDPSKGVADQQEADLVRYLCKSGEVLHRGLPEALGVTGRFLLATHVVEPLRDSRRASPGDIDVVIIPLDSPEHAIAIECKVVPVVSNGVVRTRDGYELSDREDRNRFQSLKRGVNQLAALCALEFHQTYQCVILATDASNSDTVEHWFRRAADTTYRKIAEIRDSQAIPESCGLTMIEITQTTEKHIMYRGRLGPRVQRRSALRRQSEGMTDRVRRLLQSPLEFLAKAEPTTHYVPNPGYPLATLHSHLRYAEQ